MDFYRVVACYSRDGNDWRIIEYIYCTKEQAITEAKQFYKTNKWNNVAVELDNATEPGGYCATMIWDAGHDKISNFAWD